MRPFAACLAFLACLACVAGPGPAASQAPGDPPRPSVERARELIDRGEHAEAARLLDRLTAAQPENAQAWMLLGWTWHTLGELERALPAHVTAAGFADTEGWGTFHAARAHALLGDADAAFEWLARLDAVPDFDMATLDEEPDLTSLRDDPRWARLRTGLPATARPFFEDTRVIRVWLGETAGDEFGRRARSIGDVDEDGVSDVAVSAPQKGIGGPRAGRVYVYSAASGRLIWSRDGKPGDRLGTGLTAVGDLNGDGVPDVAVGSPGAGRVHVLSGRDGKECLALEATAEDDAFGSVLARVGDLDEDGRDDLFVGIPLNDTNGKDAGRAFVYSGRTGEPIVTLWGEHPGDRLGSAGAGHVSGAGRWLAIGAAKAGPGNRGQVFVYTDPWDLPRFVLEPLARGDRFGGNSISVVGDTDGDAIPDLLVSDLLDPTRGYVTGRAYLHSGADGKRRLVFTGEAAGDSFGSSVTDAGDLDGDGHADLVTGAAFHRGGAPAAGKAYVISGRSGALLRTYTSRTPDEQFGSDIDTIGDVDGDGTPDLLIGAPGNAENGANAGRVLIVSGAIPAHGPVHENPWTVKP